MNPIKPILLCLLLAFLAIPAMTAYSFASQISMRRRTGRRDILSRD
ncbi:MAG: hypothetical protein ACE5J9_08765 [Methanosarcinales archaeon]